MRESFVVHAEYLLDIPEESKLQFYSYILEFGIYGIKPKVSGFELKAWNVIQRRIEDDAVKYQKSTVQKKINSINFKIKNNTASEKDKEKLQDLNTTLNNLNNSEDFEIFQNIQNNSHTGVSVSDSVSLSVPLSDSVSLSVSDSVSECECVSEEKNSLSKPTYEDIDNYIIQKELNVNTDEFIEYYEACKWEGVKNWKQKLLDWHKLEKRPNARPAETTKFWEKN